MYKVIIDHNPSQSDNEVVKEGLKGDVRALAGFRFLEFLAWGKVLYIDDLITDFETRRNGHGGKLLKWVIEQGKKAGCDQVHFRP